MCLFFSLSSRSVPFLIAPFRPFSNCSTLDAVVSYLHCRPQHWSGTGESQSYKERSSRQLGSWEDGGWAGLILFVQVHCNAACGVNIFHFITPGPGPGPVCSPGPCLGLISVVPGLWKAAVTERKTNEVAINIFAHCPTRADGYTPEAGGEPAWLGPLVPPSNHLNSQELLSAEPNFLTEIGFGLTWAITDTHRSCRGDYKRWINWINNS